MDPEIHNLPDLTIYNVMQTGMIGNSVDRTADTAFRKLNVILMKHGLLKKVDYCLGISPDEPSPLTRRSSGTVPAMCLKKW